MAIIFLSDGAGGIAQTPTAIISLYNGPKSGTVTVDTGVKEHGYSSFVHNGAASAYIARLACLADAGRRISMRTRFSAFPATNSGILRLLQGTATAAEVRLNSSGNLLLYAGASGGVLQATGTTVLSTSTWYRISLAYTITNASVSEWRVYLDGVLELTASNPASQVTGTNNLRIGWTGTTPGSGRLMYHQDLYIDDDTSLTDPGDIRVTNKRPTGTGSNNAFDTLGGTSANRWDAVAERPSGTTNYWRHQASSSVIEEYTVEAASAGDDDLTGKTIIDWSPWVYWKIATSAGTTNKMVVDGTLANIVSTATSTQWQTSEAAAGSTSYPSSDAVGLQSTGNANDIYLAGCGVFIAYTTSTSASVTVPLATIAGQAYAATIQVRVNGALTTGAVDAIAPTITNISPPVNVSVPVATIGGDAFAATIRIRINGDLATGALAAPTPAMDDSVPAPVATVSGQSYAATIQVRVNGALATGALSAIAPTIAISTDIAVPVATIAGQSYAATIRIKINGALATGTFSASIPLISIGGTPLDGQFSATLVIDRSLGGALVLEEAFLGTPSLEHPLGGAVSIGDPWEALMYTGDAWTGNLEVGET